MLHLLKNNREKKQRFFPGKARFNPLLIPSYRAGYLMNQTTDVPPGSIDPVPASSNWFDAKILGPASKFLQSPSASELQIVNGFNCFVLNATDTRLANFAFDVFTNAFTNFSILLAYKKNAAISNYNMLFAQNNSAEDERCYIAYTPGDLLQVQLSNAAGANAINCFSVNTYDDQQIHALVAVFNQTTKTCRLITHTGENITNTNAAYVSKNLQGNSFGDFKLGEWNFAPLYSAQPGCYGDVIIFNQELNDGQINALLRWECDRLAIVHVPI
jgi:hypothetical protein